MSIYGVGYSDLAFGGKYIAYVAGVAFCSVADKHFVGRDVYAAFPVVVFYYFFAQKHVALFRSVAFERGGIGFIGDSLVHGFYRSGANGACHIAYAHSYNRFSFVGRCECLDSSGYLREEVACRKFDEIVVYSNHVSVRFQLCLQIQWWRLRSCIHARLCSIQCRGLRQADLQSLCVRRVR